MSQGLRVHNLSGNILISDEIETLHFLGKASRIADDGGDYFDFPTYSGIRDDYLDGRRIFTYRITSSVAPVVFIKPGDISKFCAMLTQEEIATDVWEFSIMVVGGVATSYPELYCFVKSDNVPISNEPYGLVVKTADGSTKTFDSRISPLTVVAGLEVKPPESPCNSGIPTTTSGHPWNYATLDWDFGSSDQYTAYSTGTTVNVDNLMFSATSVAQAVYKRQMHGHKKSCGYGGSGCQDHWSTAVWWVMYRNAFRLRDGYIDSGWGNYAAGYTFSSHYEDGGWFGGGGGSYSTGSMPYTAKTINTSSSNFVMLADASRYG